MIQLTHTLNVNDRVQHYCEVPLLCGTIIGTMFSEQVDEDMDPGEPWYQIEWDDVTMVEGCEHQDSLIKI